MSRISKARILIVDDDPASVRILARALAPELTCEFALSGPEALAWLASGDLPDLILLDVMMPEMDGYALCRRLKSDPRTRDIPAIFITASNDVESETQALLAGAADFIPKPVNPQVVRLRVGLQVLLRSRERALQQLNAELEQRVAERTRALSEALGRAESANRAKSVFLANLSHEIRTPLNGILGLVGLLARKETEPDKRHRLEQVAQCAETLHRVLANLLEISNIEANRVLLEPRDFTTHELAQRLRGAIAPAALAKGIALTLALDALPPRLRGDRERLSQLLTALLDNAVKFTRRGSVGLSAACLEDLADGRVLLAFKVADTGCGIPPQARERIFQPFEQADASATRTFGGTGLGLAIARQLTELMHGGLRLERSDDSGSVFIAEVWLERAADALGSGSES